MSDPVIIDSHRCAACGGQLEWLGIQHIRMGGAGGGWLPLLGNWGEAGEWLWDVALVRCAECGRYDFYDKDSPLAENLK